MFPGHSVEGSLRRRFVKYLLLYGFCLLGAPLFSSVASAQETPAPPPATSWVDLSPGFGKPIASGALVEVRYLGKLASGKVFDRSHATADVPFRFVYGVTRLIPGWNTALAGMMPGGRRTVTIPPSQAYGVGGLPGVVPPGATLIYEIEVLKVD